LLFCRVSEAMFQTRFCTSGPPSLLSDRYRGSFPGVKRPGREADHSPPSVEVKMRGAISPLPQCAFMAWYLVKHMDNCTISFSVIVTVPSHLCLCLPSCLLPSFLPSFRFSAVFLKKRTGASVFQKIDTCFSVSALQLLISFITRVVTITQRSETTGFKGARIKQATSQFTRSLK
jgi:hypothetical protein